MNAIEIRGLSKSFCGLYALDGLNMTVPVGSIYGFIGENGSGKSGRMFTMPLIYIMVGACFVLPVIILVMTTMMDGTVSVNPQTGVETVVEGFDNVWQIIGSVSSGTNANTVSMAMDMSLSLLLSFAVGMLLFMMLPMLTPLNATAMNVILCLAGGILFSVGLGAISNQILKKPVWYNKRQCRFYLDLEAALFL